MKHSQANTQVQPALLRNNSGIDTPVKNSLCCTAAGITALPCGTAEALIPHRMLRGAALKEATLNAQSRPLAQPVMGYRPPSRVAKAPPMVKDGRVMELMQGDHRPRMTA